jgi:hypothetical protein
MLNRAIFEPLPLAEHPQSSPSLERIVNNLFPEKSLSYYITVNSISISGTFHLGNKLFIFSGD